MKVTINYKNFRIRILLLKADSVGLTILFQPRIKSDRNPCFNIELSRFLSDKNIGLTLNSVRLESLFRLRIRTE